MLVELVDCLSTTTYYTSTFLFPFAVHAEYVLRIYKLALIRSTGYVTYFRTLLQINCSDFS